VSNVLSSIRIRNLALIDDLEIALGAGLTILTGETGAGKSIIVGALNLLLGDRASAELIRQGQNEAEVEALFHLSPTDEVQLLLADMELADDDGMMVVRRVLSRAGKNRVYINGRLATLTGLRAVVSPLIDISSQHAHTSLLKVAEHRAILDRFGDLTSVRASYHSRFEAWRSAHQQLTSLMTAEADRSHRLDMLEFQASEIDEVSPTSGEERELASEIEVLRHAKDLRDAATKTERELHSRSGSVTDQLGDIEQTLRDAAHADPSLEAMAARVESARIEIEDLGMEARDYRSRIHVDKKRLTEAEDRLDALRRLMRRYGPELDQVVARRVAIAEELATLEAFDDRLAALQEASSTARSEAERHAQRLTEARRRTGKRAAAAVVKQLEDLGMGGARLAVSVEPTGNLTPLGSDHVEFLLSSNIGEPPMPLARIASGGELSRILLAIKHVLAETDSVHCYVFDEVDTGVSGGVAERIGVKLFETARSRQALCITHLPQVASHADTQLRVEKQVKAGRTVTHVRTLNAAERQEEIARLLAGMEVTEQARAHAAEMLEQAARQHL
jgi:DNA repair protein RecN (Recombination protein N)